MERRLCPKVSVIRSLLHNYMFAFHAYVHDNYVRDLRYAIIMFEIDKIVDIKSTCML